MLTKADKQRLFDAALTGIRAQGGLSYDAPYGGCRYRLPMPDGSIRKCAIGHSIPDERYDVHLEGVSAGDPCIRDTLGIPSDERDGAYLEELQSCHDTPVRWPAPPFFDGDASYLADFEARMRDLAIQHGLNYFHEEG